MSELGFEAQPLDFSPNETKKEYVISTGINSSDSLKDRIKQVDSEINRIANDEFINVLESQGYDWSLEPVVVQEAVVNKVYHGQWGINKTGKKDTTLEAEAEKRLTERLLNGEHIPQQVDVVYSVRDDGIEAAVRDQGNPFDWQVKLQEAVERVTKDENLMDESGRGLFLAVKVLGKENISFEDGGRVIKLFIKKKANN